MKQSNVVIFKNAQIIYFRLIVTSILGFVGSGIVIRNLGDVDFGLYSVIGSVVVVASVLNSAMISTSYRYIAVELGRKDGGDVNRVFNVSLVIHLFLALVVLFATESLGVYYVENILNIGSGRIPDALFVLRFSSWLTICAVVVVPYQGLMTAQENFKVISIIEIVRSFSTFVAAVCLIFFDGNKLRLLAILAFSVGLMSSSLYLVCCRHSYRQLVAWKLQRSSKLYLEMIQYSGWILVGAGASVGQASGLPMILNWFFGAAINTSYGIALQINNVVQMFSQNLAQAAIPQITKSFSAGNEEGSVSLTAYISKYTILLMMFLALPILLNLNFLLTLWLGTVPPYAESFCQFMIINGLIGGLGRGLPALIQAHGNIKPFQLVLSTTSIVVLPISYFLFSLGFSPSHIFIPLIVTSVLNIIAWQFLLSRFIKFDVYAFVKISYLRVFGVCIFLTPLAFLKGHFSESLLTFVVLSLSATCWMVLGLIVVGLDPKEKAVIYKAVNDIFQRVKL